VEARVLVRTPARRATKPLAETNTVEVGEISLGIKGEIWKPLGVLGKPRGHSPNKVAQSKQLASWDTSGCILAFPSRLRA